MTEQIKQSQGEYTSIDQLGKDDFDVAEVLEGVLGEKIVLMIYSKTAKKRSQAFVDLDRGLAKFDFNDIEKEERNDIFISLFAVMVRGTADLDFQVNMHGIQLILNMMKNHSKNFQKLDD